MILIAGELTQQHCQKVKTQLQLNHIFYMDILLFSYH
ncbi:hypothetical protein IOK_15372 [Yersinia enterocolitica subsp. palearctica PhRBD_Ye1]|nr:hypothetical protein IOK_15372 [Yersinia enterocolitica subsp. palearctica PhRBD_Ye1]